MKINKRKNIICLIAISLILVFICIIYINLDNDKSFIYNDVTYALKVDGKSVKAFPEKETYRVDVDCENAKGKWDYLNWKLDISNINGNISCSISFNTIEKTYFSDYLMTLEGQTQGNGMFVHEESVVRTPTYNTVTPLTQSEYGTPEVYYSSNDAFETSGTAVSNLLSFSNNQWSINTGSIPKNWTFYHFKFNVPEDGYYQVCYNMGVGSASNRLWVYNGESAILEALKANTSSASTGCVNLGLVKTNSFIKIVHAAIKYNNAYIPVSFSIKKADPNDVTETRTDADYRYQVNQYYI